MEIILWMKTDIFKVHYILEMFTRYCWCLGVVESTMKRCVCVG